MFGLENQKKKKKGGEEFVFDLEKSVKDAGRYADLLKHIEMRIQQIKESLRHGENQEAFDKYGRILHGYTSLMKVLARAAAAGKKA